MEESNDRLNSTAQGELPGDSDNESQGSSPTVDQTPNILPSSQVGNQSLNVSETEVGILKAGSPAKTFHLHQTHPQSHSTTPQSAVRPRGLPVVPQNQLEPHHTTTDQQQSHHTRSDRQPPPVDFETRIAELESR